ncbi:putative metalloprotease CJM1_0395 family protein [Candidatus Vondammii sp. HM_W22]|uniref:putative metalloprotease CJM1_0395 family protein n=1 Tax=Candidatus Vondammii sp. HM_W22 TaxID=2687299 RepID=UPI001F140633|nr:putative metalloprotease CJM1_0395 family protein [Candidatus Vondammii sp. HM_W22]
MELNPLLRQKNQPQLPIEKQQALGDPNSEEAIELRKLQVRDREVRAHEQAHLAAAGHSYAFGGEIRIDTSVISGDPQATLEKAETIRQAGHRTGKLIVP